MRMACARSTACARKRTKCRSIGALNQMGLSRAGGESSLPFGIFMTLWSSLCSCTDYLKTIRTFVSVIRVTLDVCPRTPLK